MEGFEARTLPRERWTHQAHLVVAFLYLSRLSPDDALVRLRSGITAYNASVGTANTDTSGYHETITRLYVAGVEEHIGLHGHLAAAEQLNALLASPMGASDWPLRFYTRDRLFSVEARRQWIEPDRSGAPQA